MSSKIEPEPEHGREWRKPGAREGYIRGTERQLLRKAAPSAQIRPPASLHMLLLVLHVFDSTPSDWHPAKNGRVQVERHLCLCFVYCFVSVFAFMPVLALKMSVYD